VVEKAVHRKFVHPKVSKSVILSGQPRADSKHYQEKDVKAAIEESQK
jgi:hypothetical protein